VTLRSPAEYQASLRDGRRVYIHGRRAKNLMVARSSGAARTLRLVKQMAGNEEGDGC
jgi:hypothetical protein